MGCFDQSLQNTGRTTCKYINLAHYIVIYQSWKQCWWVCLHLYIIRLKVVIGEMRRHRWYEKMRWECIVTTLCQHFWYYTKNKIKTYHPSNNIILELLDVLRADLEPCMKCSRLRSLQSHTRSCMLCEIFPCKMNKNII